MRKYLLLISFLILLLQGCFESKGKVTVIPDRNNSTVYIDNQEVRAGVPIELLVGEHSLKVIAPIDSQWEYFATQKFTVLKDKTIKLNIKTEKIATKERKEYIKKLAQFQPQKYKFHYYYSPSKEELEKIKQRVDALLDNNEFDKIDPADIKVLGYEKKIEKIYKQITHRNDTSVSTISLNAHSEEISGMAIDKKHFYTTSYDNHIKIWNKSTLKTIKDIYYKSYDRMRNLDIDDKYIYVSNYATLLRYDKNSYKALKQRYTNDMISHFKVGKQKIFFGLRASYRNNYIGIYNKKNFKLLKKIHLKAQSLNNFYLDSQYIYVVRNYNLKVYGQNSGKLYKKIDFKTFTNDVVCDKKYIYIVLNHEVKILDKKTYKELASFKTPDSSKFVDVDKKYLYVGTSDAVEIWDKKKHLLLKTLPKYKSYISSFLVQKGKIYTGYRDGKLIMHTIEDDLKSVHTLYTKISALKHKMDTYSIDMKDLKLHYEIVYKYGKIGEIYVPSVSYSSTTPHTSHTYVNGHSYTTTTYTHETSTSSGYTTDRQGYKAINRITNHSNNYYYIKIKSSWKGKYTTVSTSSNWGGGESRNWSHKYQDGYKYSTFIIPPGKSIKYQFEVGEEKAPITTQIIDAYIVPPEYAEKLYEALDEKNEYIVLIDKFLSDPRIAAWHEKLNNVRRNIIDKKNSELYEKYKEDVKLSFSLSPNYDPDFGGDVTISLETPTAMCVHVATPFGTKELYLNGKGQKVYKGIKGLSKKPNIYIKDLTLECSKNANNEW